MESSVNVGRVKGRGLDQGQSVLLGKLTGFLSGDLLKKIIIRKKNNKEGKQKRKNKEKERRGKGITKEESLQRMRIEKKKKKKKKKIIKADLTQVLQIALVSDKHNDNVLSSILTKLSQPPLNVLVGNALGDIVAKQSPNSSTIVGTGDGTVSFLSSSIPNLSLDSFAVDLNAPCGELNTNGGLGLQGELVPGETAQQVGLSNTRVPNKDN